jgi:hypothetical protein
MTGQIGPFALYLESMRNDQVDGIGDSLDQYLNSGMLISWSLVALKTAWSGYQFSLVLVVVVAEPVVVRPFSSLVAAPLAGAVDIEAVVERTGSSTHFSWSNVTAT